ncbi:MAG: glycerophosphodiester phosphodiesterase [Bacillota bacterium]
MTLILAHRGYSASYPENTMLAFVEAESVGADGLELDVQMTKDGELVVIHDEKVNRTTDGKGFIKDFTAEELRKLDAGHQYKSLAKREKIPLLEEVFEWLMGNTMVCNVEFKNGLFPYKGMEEKVIALVRQYQLENRIVLSSFNHYSVVHSTSLAPEIETAPLLAEGLYMPWIYAKSIRSSGFHPHYRAAPDQIIKQAIEAGIAVRPYTVNKETEMERLIKVGCSAIITDDPFKGVKKRLEIMKRS